MNRIIVYPIKINISNIHFGSKNLIQKPQIKSGVDKFVSNTFVLDNNKSNLEEIVRTNSQVMNLLNQYSLPLKINIEELEKLKQGHLNETRVVAAKIYSSLPEELKKDVDLRSLQEAAMLHDFGKVLIPKTILCKPSKLNSKEKEIMQLHSLFGYELLRNKGLDEKTLNLIKYHHQNLKGNGYPEIGKDFNFNIEAQILAAADRYTALREKRSYKDAMAKYEALETIAKEVNDGNLSQDVYTALVKSIW